MDHDLKLATRVRTGSNSNDGDEAKHGKGGEKTVTHDRDVEDGHLVELEVDLSRILHEADQAEGDWDADTSPFAAVRAVVPETDDPGMPINTFRAWFLGIVSRAPSPDEP